MRSIPWVLLAALALGGCGLTKPDVDPKLVEPPPSPLLDFQLFPPVAGSARLLAEATNARLEFDPTTKDALTALGLCVDAAVYCYEPGGRSLEDCLAHTRTCATSEPWNEAACCPKACKDDFEAAVKKGEAPSAALERVFFTERRCFPGVRELLEGP